ncbi:hypothetical protein ScalyP_jg11017 [Parmales sp. scaly parma]|nr:hypothetical protein ScalyP_jg11017 [Parmales sp. scaly parma]
MNSLSPSIRTSDPNLNPAKKIRFLPNTTTTIQNPPIRTSDPNLNNPLHLPTPISMIQTTKLQHHTSKDRRKRLAFMKNLDTSQLHSSYSRTELHSLLTHNVHSSGGEDSWESVEDSLFFPTWKKEGPHGGSAKSSGIVQTSPAELLAFIFDVDSDHLTNSHIKRNNCEDLKLYPNKIVATINDHHIIHYQCIKMPFPLLPREWLTRLIYKQLEPEVESSSRSYLLTVNSVPAEHPDVPDYIPSRAPGVILGELSADYKFTPLPFNQTKITKIATLDLKGAIPISIAASFLSSSVDTPKQAYNYFQRDDEVDKMVRNKFISNMPLAPQKSPEETATVQKCLQFASGGVESWTRIIPNLGNTHSSVERFTRILEGDPAAWGKAVSIVHTSAEKALAYVWDFCSNCRMKEHAKTNGNILRKFYDPSNLAAMSFDNSKARRSCYTVVQKTTPFMSNLLARQSSFRSIWDKLDDEGNTLVMAFVPAEVEYNDLFSDDSVVRKTNKRQMVSNLVSKISSKLVSSRRFSSAIAARSLSKEKSSTHITPVNSGVLKSRSPGMLEIELDNNSRSFKGGLDQLSSNSIGSSVSGSLSGKRKKKFVSLKVTGVWTFRRLAENVCEVSYVCKLVDKGNIPAAIMNAQVGKALKPVFSISRFYDRKGGDVDEELREQFVFSMNSDSDSDHRQFADGEMSLVDANANTGWEEMKDSNAFVKLSKKQIKGERTTWGKAVSTIDSPAEEVLAWFWDSLSNDRLEATLDLKNNPNKIIGGNDSNNHRVFSSIKQMPYPLWPRLFVYESAWTKLSDNEFVYVWRPVGADKYKHDDLGVGASTVRAESRGYVTIKRLGDYSCLVTYVQFVDLKVPFGAKYTKSLHHSSLSDIFSLRKTFNRDDEIDKIDRNKLVSAMIHSNRGQHDEIYTDAENSVFKRVETKLGSIKESSFKSLASPDFRTKMGIAHVKGSASAYLKVEVVVDASIEECAAYNFMQKSREKMKMNDRKDVLFMDTRSHNSHCSDNLLVRDLGYGTTLRRFLSRHMWKRVGSKMIHVLDDLENSELFEEEISKFALSVRASYQGLYSYEAVGGGVAEFGGKETKLKFLGQITIGGLIPSQIVDLTAVRTLTDFAHQRSDTVASWRFTQISPTMTTVELLSDPEAATKRKKNFYHKEKHRGRRNLGSLSFDKPNARKLGKREVTFCAGEGN